MSQPNEDQINAHLAQAQEEDLYGRIDFSKQARRFSEVQDEIAPQGTRVKLADLQDREVVFRSLKFFEGRFGPCVYAVMTTPEGEIINTLINAKIILPKLKMISDQLPISAVVVKKSGGQFGEYYDLE